MGLPLSVNFNCNSLSVAKSYQLCSVYFACPLDRTVRVVHLFSCSCKYQQLGPVTALHDQQSSLNQSRILLCNFAACPVHFGFTSKSYTTQKQREPGQSADRFVHGV